MARAAATAARASGGSCIISSRIRSAPAAARVAAIRSKARAHCSSGGIRAQSRSSLPATIGTMCDSEPATATGVAPAARSRASRAISTARRLSSVKRSPQPAAASMIGLEAKVLAVITRAPARM